MVYSASSIRVTAVSGFSNSANESATWSILAAKVPTSRQST